MITNKYIIVDMNEYSLNEAYSKGYEIVSVFSQEENYQEYCNGTIMNTTATINLPSSRKTVKVLMQLTKVGEILNGTTK